MRRGILTSISSSGICSRSITASRYRPHRPTAFIAHLTTWAVLSAKSQKMLYPEVGGGGVSGNFETLP